VRLEEIREPGHHGAASLRDVAGVGVIRGAIAMLLAPESRWINGQRIEASGGMIL
jgi:hypothetical protein